MMKLFLIFTIAILINCADAEDPYCKQECWSGKHTKCENPDSTKLGENCDPRAPVGLTEDQKKKIVKMHNEFRQKVARGEETRGDGGGQPAAKNMPNLVWDDELADIAQTWANQCKIGHDDCRRVDRFEVGQNIAWSGKSDRYPDDVTFAVNAWYNEVNDFEPRTIPSFEGAASTKQKTVAHYTQLVWGKTTTIGCGASRFINKRQMHMLLVVCNYGPMGNWIKDPVYES